MAQANLGTATRDKSPFVTCSRTVARVNGSPEVGVCCARYWKHGDVKVENRADRFGRSAPEAGARDTCSVGSSWRAAVAATN